MALNTSQHCVFHFLFFNYLHEVIVYVFSIVFTLIDGFLNAVQALSIPILLFEVM